MTLGQRVKQLRKRRRITQRQLADGASVSIDVVRKLEQGQRFSVRLDSLVRLANALDVPVAELIGKPQGLAVGGDNGEVLALRRAIHATDSPDIDLPAPKAMSRAIAELWRMYWTGKYGELAHDLPHALAQARGAVRDRSGEERRLAHAAHAELLQVAGSLLAHLAYEDLAQLALVRAVAEAEAADNPLLRATQKATSTWVLARQGLWREAEHLAVTSATEIEPVISRAGADELAVWGELLRYGITAIMRDGRRSEAEEMQRMVWAAAAAMGGRKPALAGVAAFGQTLAGMSAVGIAVATDEPRRALDLAAGVGSIDTAPLSIQARYLLNVAYAQTMDWRSREAVDTLRRAESLAPEIMPYQTIARAIVEELLPRRRTQRLPGLTAIAERIGVAVPPVK